LKEDTKVSLKVYNLIGEEINTLVDEHQTAGYKSFEFDASNLPSGIYIYRIVAGNFIKSNKMILLK
jgi:flagellar hook assembly protein FlgD